MIRLAIAGLLLAVALLGCDPPCEVPMTFTTLPDEHRGSTMRPGQNCLRCHSAGKEAGDKPFSVGGTVFSSKDSSACDGVPGATVRVTDATGKRVTLHTNSVGNFYSKTPLEPPLHMELEYQGRTATMPVTAPTGGCALCHSWPDAVAAEGRIRVPE